MIAHWPQGISQPGDLCRFPAHIVDIMPTVVELAAADYPSELGEQQIMPMEGQSLLPALQGLADARSKPIFWEFSGNHAIRDADWKLVAERSKDWELYDMAADRTETNNLASQYPERVQQLAQKYDSWAIRTGAKTHAKCLKAKPSTQSQLFDLDAILHPSEH
jgi:arylsulfatase